MESTTISGASGSRPRCATSMPLRPFLNSTALMLEDPTSRPTIVFDPNPNMCPPLLLPGSLGSCLRFLSALRFHLAGLVFHPLVELRFLEAPAIAQLESRNLLLAHVLVKRVRTDSQVLRSLANVHHFPRVGHSFETLFPHFEACQHLQSAFKFGRIPRTNCVRENSGVPSIYQPCKHPRRRRSSAIYRVLCLFPGNWPKGA